MSSEQKSPGSKKSKNERPTRKHNDILLIISDVLPAKTLQNGAVKHETQVKEKSKIRWEKCAESAPSRPFWWIISAAFFKSHIAHPGGSVSDKTRAGIRLWCSPAGILTDCPLAPTSSVVKPPVLGAHLHKPAPPVTWIQRRHRPDVCVSVATPCGCYETLQPKNKLSSNYFRVARILLYRLPVPLSLWHQEQQRPPVQVCTLTWWHSFNRVHLLCQSDPQLFWGDMYCRTETNMHWALIGGQQSHAWCKITALI